MRTIRTPNLVRLGQAKRLTKASIPGGLPETNGPFQEKVGG
jgi:hypothetical protein